MLMWTIKRRLVSINCLICWGKRGRGIEQFQTISISYYFFSGIIFETYESYTPVLILVSLVKVLSSLLFLWASKCFPEIKETIRVKISTNKKISSKNNEGTDIANDNVKDEESALLTMESGRFSYSKLPSENSAKKTEIHPNKWADSQISKKWLTYT